MAATSDLLVGERTVLEMIAAGEPLPDVLTMLCVVIDQQSGLMSSVYLLDYQGKKLTLAAGPHLPEPWRQCTSTVAVSPTNTACGASVCSRKPIVVADVATSPLAGPATSPGAPRLERGHAPFWADGRVLGTLPSTADARRPTTRCSARRTREASCEHRRQRHQIDDTCVRERRFSTVFFSPAMTIHRYDDGRFLYQQHVCEPVRLLACGHAGPGEPTLVGVLRVDWNRQRSTHPGSPTQAEGGQVGAVIDMVVWTAHSHSR